jgi:hypothetical protein
MHSKRNIVLAIIVLAGFFIAVTPNSTVFAAGQAASAPAQPSAAPAITPDAPQVAAGEVEAKKLLLMMDVDKSGTVSKAEFIAFMEAEFARLDKNKDGVLDVKELEKSQLVPAHHGGGHR